MNGYYKIVLIEFYTCKIRKIMKRTLYMKLKFYFLKYPMGAVTLKFLDVLHYVCKICSLKCFPLIIFSSEHALSLPYIVSFLINEAHSILLISSSYWTFIFFGFNGDTKIFTFSMYYTV